MRHVYVSLDKKINVVFTDYRDIKFKLTAHRLGSENRNTVLWNKNYRNTAPKKTQYRNTANPYAPILSTVTFTMSFRDGDLRMITGVF